MSGGRAEYALGSLSPSPFQKPARLFPRKARTNGDPHAAGLPDNETAPLCGCLRGNVVGSSQSVGRDMLSFFLVFGRLWRVRKIQLISLVLSLSVLRYPPAVVANDSDRDGVPDEVDICPETIASPGVTIDENGCAVAFDPYVDLDYEDELHRLWYHDFWNGDCQGLPWLSCIKSEGYWSIVDKALRNTSGTQFLQLRNRLWLLGRRIGYEWARDNSKRCIDSRRVFGDDDSWARRLARADSTTISAVLTQIEHEVAEALGKPPPGRTPLPFPWERE